MENKKRSILITGGTGKIGSVLVEQMIHDGHDVIFTSTKAENAENLILKIGEINNRLSYILLNLDNTESFENIVHNLPFKVDTLIHNARNLDSLKIQPDGLSSQEDIINEFKIAVVSPYLINNLIRQYDHPLRDIIYISSMYGSVGPNKNLYDNFHHQSPIQYGICKAAQIHNVKELAIRLAENNIRVNAISFGGVEGRVSEVFLERYSKMNPSGKMINNSDLYPPIQFILNNYNMNMTGENLKIDGGWTIW